MQKQFSIACTEFNSLQSTSNGGAIMLGNMIGLIYGNLFVKCSTSAQGGASYLNNCSVSISNNVYSYCFNGHTDNNYGNVISSISGKVSFQQCSVSLCGPSISESGDSTICFRDGKFNVNYYNCSYNYGISGGNLGFFTAKSASYINYSQCLHGINDYSFIEFYSYNIFLSDSVFVNDSKLLTYFMNSGKNPITVESIFLINCSKPPYNINFLNCYANPSYQDLKLTDKYMLIDFHIDTKCYNFGNILASFEHNNNCLLHKPSLNNIIPFIEIFNL